MKDGSRETLDRVSPISISTNKNNSSMVIYLRTYGAGWFTLLFRGSSSGKRGQQKLFGIPTFRGPSANMSTFHLPLRGSQSNHFIFQMKKPDTNSSPIIPILMHSKAETRYVHCMGARLGPHTMHIPEPDTENDSCPIVSEPVHVTFANDRLS